MRIGQLILYLVVVSVVLLIHPDTPAVPARDVNTARHMATISGETAVGQLPLQFVANEGQTDSSVRFMAHGPGYNLFLTLGEALLATLILPAGRVQWPFQRPIRSSHGPVAGKPLSPRSAIAPDPLQLPGCFYRWSSSNLNSN